MKGNKNENRYGSDLMAELIANLDVPYIAMNPGSSYRGLHDSLINHPTRSMPEIITCTHEGISVDVASGYAKATGKPMAAAIHNVVGLQNASMAIFNAWSDRSPVLLFGGTGPMATELRRPWIEWIHTAQVQGNLIRDFVKLDDQPTSLPGMADSVYRAYRVAVTEPAGPVYVCFDAGLQEELIPDEQLAKYPELTEPPKLTSFPPGSPPAPNPEALSLLADAIRSAQFPVILVDHTGRSAEAFYSLSKLAEAWAIPVIDIGGRFNFPTNHPMNMSGAKYEMLEKSDLVLALDVRDLDGNVSRTARTSRDRPSLLQKGTRVFSIGLQDYLIRSWISDYQRLYPTERSILADTEVALISLRSQLDQPSIQEQHIIRQRYELISTRHNEVREAWRLEAAQKRNDSNITCPAVAHELWQQVQDKDYVLVNGDLEGWIKRIFAIKEARQYIPHSNGGGVGSHIGTAIGVCLAHRHTGKLIVNIQSDGDLLFTTSGLWTLAHHQLPVLTIMFNNRSYYNSESHQIATAEARGRDTTRARIGTRIVDPHVDFAGLARTFGVHGIGPIEQTEDIDQAIKDAITYIEETQKPVLIDIVTQVRN